MATAEQWIVRGHVTAAHGVKGYVRLVLQTDFPERVAEAKSLTFRFPSGQVRTFDLEKVGAHKTGLLAKLAGIDDRNGAETLRGAELVVRGDELPELGEHEIYWHQLVGMRVVTDDGREIGDIVDVFRTGSNDVYVTKTQVVGRDGQQRSQEGPLIPAIPDVVLKIDTDAGRVVINPLPGLLDK